MGAKERNERIQKAAQEEHKSQKKDEIDNEEDDSDEEIKEQSKEVGKKADLPIGTIQGMTKNQKEQVSVKEEEKESD